MHVTPSTLHVPCVTAAALIRDAYIAFPTGAPTPVRNGFKVFALPSMLREPLKGAPKWLETDRFTIDAKSSKPVANEMMRGPMMQRILTQRFRLQLHRETRQVPVYEMTVAKTGVKFGPSKPDSCIELDPEKGPPTRRSGGRNPIICGGTARSEKGGVDALGITMNLLCYRLSLSMDRDVNDKTGLDGLFDLHLDLNLSDFRPNPARFGRGPALPPDLENSEPGDPITRALRKVGLELRPAKESREFPVIDHIELPAGN